jgi:hypothetical protein
MLRIGSHLFPLVQRRNGMAAVLTDGILTQILTTTGRIVCREESSAPSAEVGTLWLENPRASTTPAGKQNVLRIRPVDRGDGVPSYTRLYEEYPSTPTPPMRLADFIDEWEGRSASCR